MANFNTYIESNFATAVFIKEGYQAEQTRGERFSQTEAGSPRIRRMFPQSYYTMTIRVAGLFDQDVAAIRTKYDTAEDIDEVTDPFTGTVFACVWMEPPTLVAIQGEFSVMEFKFYCWVA